MKRRLAIEALETRSWRANADNTGWLLLALGAVMLPHMMRMPVWVSLTFCVLAAWRWLVISRGVMAPGRWLMVALAVAAIVAIMVQYRGALGRDSGVALLALLAGLKLLETRLVRDAYVTLFLAYFLVVTNFLYSQSIVTGLYMCAVTLMTTAALVGLQHGEREMPPGARVKLSGRLLAQAIPLMLVGFVLFPRLPGPLWGLPKDAHAGVTGLSDSMSPGQVSSLSRSNAIAFRVKFHGEAPDPSYMYWRGPVLELTDGYKWRRNVSRVRRTAVSSLASARDQQVNYTVTLEPTRQRWLFALELNASLPDGAALLDTGELMVSRAIHERRRYDVSSHLSFTLPARSPEELVAATALPVGFHPRTRQLAQGWAAQTPDPEQLVARVLAWFRTQPFAYTLEPPLLTGDPVDEFMFLSRRGFCEHYAAAFTVMMRAAGVPARVVTGYQGGEFNEVSGFWLVRQRDAHAWSEVWLGERGWVRVDPTAAVAPERVELGMDEALPDSAADVVFGLAKDNAFSGLWRRARLGWLTVNNSWNQWVLGYGSNNQRAFLSGLGLDVSSWRDVAFAFLVAAAFALMLVAAWVWRRPAAGDACTAAYVRFCRALAAQGVTRAAWEGPVDYARRAQAQLPGSSAQIAAVVEAYVAARYGGGGTAAVTRLRDAVKAYRPH